MAGFLLLRHNFVLPIIGVILIQKLIHCVFKIKNHMPKVVLLAYEPIFRKSFHQAKEGPLLAEAYYGNTAL